MNESIEVLLYIVYVWWSCIVGVVCIYDLYEGNSTLANAGMNMLYIVFIACINVLGYLDCIQYRRSWYCQPCVITTSILFYYIMIYESQYGDNEYIRKMIGCYVGIQYALDLFHECDVEWIATATFAGLFALLSFYVGFTTYEIVAIVLTMLCPHTVRNGLSTGCALILVSYK